VREIELGRCYDFEIISPIIKTLCWRMEASAMPDG